MEKMLPTRVAPLKGPSTLLTANFDNTLAYLLIFTDNWREILSTQKKCCQQKLPTNSFEVFLKSCQHYLLTALLSTQV